MLSKQVNWHNNARQYVECPDWLICLSGWFLVQQDDKSGKEAILDDMECPLQIFRDWPADRGESNNLL